MNVPWKCVFCDPDALLWCLNLVISPSISSSCHSPKPHCLFLKIKLILSFSHTWVDKMFTCLLLMGLSQCVTATGILCPPPFARSISPTVESCQRHVFSCLPPASISFHLLITFLTQYRNLYPSLPLSICAACSLILFSTPSCLPFPHTIYHRWQWVKNPLPPFTVLISFKIPSFIPCMPISVTSWGQGLSHAKPWQGVKSSHATQNLATYSHIYPDWNSCFIQAF